MSVFKCKMCGGTIEIEPGSTVGTCEYCGTKQTLPKLDDERRVNLYDRANHFRRNNEFDKAEGIYEKILNEDTTDAEAYWSLVLCRYGIEYVEDPVAKKRVPTVNRAQFTSIFDDDNYKSAIQYADSYQRTIYEEEANVINEIQKGILAISQKEEPFDVFICYKETDNNGRRTQDSVLANDLYHQLVNEGFKVFFSRITLEDKLGTAYEPYIFAALNSAKVMVVLGTKPEHFNAVWVKNEWSRYLALVKQSGGTKVLIPAYRDMDPYDLPEEFSHLQAQDMSRLGFMQDLIRGIKKIARTEEPKFTVKETAAVGTAANVTPLLKRAFMFLEDGDWGRADDFCEQVLNQEPENAEAYLGKLMAELQVRQQEDLPNCKQPFNNSNNYQKAIRFGGEKIARMLSGCIDHINERNEKTRLTEIYNNAVAAMKTANTEEAYKTVAETFGTIHGFNDADKLAEECLYKAKMCYYNIVVEAMNSANTEQEFRNAAESLKKLSGFKDADKLAEECVNQAEAYRKNGIYDFALFQMSKNTIDGYEDAIRAFNTIPDWRDADEQIKECVIKIEQIKEDLEKEKIAIEENKKRFKKKVAIAVPIIILCIVLTVVYSTVIAPKQKYTKAINLLDAGDYDKAYALLEEIGDEKTISSSKYERAIALLEEEKYDKAYLLLNEIGDKETIHSSKHDRAIAKLEEKEFEEAYTLLRQIGDEETISSSKYERAIALLEEKDYKGAYELLKGLNYKDSESVLASIGHESPQTILSDAKEGSYVYFGSYEQDNKTSNGKEDIEWLVLAKENNRILVISRYALDYQKYNSKEAEITWEDCSLRNWLNESFISEAFNTEERAIIPTVTVSAEGNRFYDTYPGNSTKDKVFLLSITEAEDYFNSDEERKCKPTEYCKAKCKDSGIGNDGSCWWCLRTPAYDLYSVAAISYNGIFWDRGLGNSLDVDQRNPVRPALWIEINS